MFSRAPRAQAGDGVFEGVPVRVADALTSRSGPR
jgi:hypothetical protein